MTEPYHKINSLQKRYTEGPLKGRFTGEWCDPVHEYLQHNDWYCREKVDGTNIRVSLERNMMQTGQISTLTLWGLNPEKPVKRTIAGRTDNAQIPGPLLARLEELFPLEKLTDYFGIPEDVSFKDITLYGEGFGAGIQKGGAYGPVDFILFDVKIGDFWLAEENISDIAENLGIRRVPYVTRTLRKAINEVASHSLISWLKVDSAGYNTRQAEGYVCVPKVPLFNKWGERVIVKIKGVDFPS
jgi:RNA ligase